MQDLIQYTDDGDMNINFIRIDDDIYGSQKQMANLYGVTPQNITTHLKNAEKDGEIDKERACKYHLQAQKEGSRTVNKEILHYNLETIVLIGFRCKSPRAKAFQEWATNVIRDYALKGFVINPNIVHSEEAVNKLTNRLYELRTDEAVIYKKLRDIIAKASDYDPNSTIARNFYSMVQNKIYYAATLMTSAEIKVTRADGNKPFMGTETRKSDKLTKADVNTAKAFLKEKEMFILQRLSTIFIDSAELAELTNQSHTMQYWVDRIDMIIKDNVLPLLNHFGKVSAKQADAHIDKEFEVYKNNLKLNRVDSKKSVNA